MERGERGGRRKNGENGMVRRRKAEGLRVKVEGEGRKTAPPIAPPPRFKRVKGREKGERRPLLCPPPHTHTKKKKKKKKILGTQIFLAQLNGVWAPLCKAKRF